MQHRLIIGGAIVALVFILTIARERFRALRQRLPPLEIPRERDTVPDFGRARLAPALCRCGAASCRFYPTGEA